VTRSDSRIRDDAAAAPARKPVGRPRASGQRGSVRSPRDEIVAVATRLFAERGYGETTMSEIARAAGLQQSSLYYWFRRKELILQAVFAVNRAPLDFVKRIGTGSESPGLKLYRLVRFDTRQLCLSPCDIHEVERLAGQRPDLFTDYWRDRQDLHDWVVLLVRAGIEEGQFFDCDADLAALTLLSIDEGTQHWVRQRDQHRRGGGAPFTYPEYEPDEVANFVAAAALRSLLRDPSELQTLRVHLAACDDTPETAHT
jgi:AcrR family transcriptional regulator